MKYALWQVVAGCVAGIIAGFAAGHWWFKSEIKYWQRNYELLENKYYRLFNQ